MVENYFVWQLVYHWCILGACICTLEHHWSQWLCLNLENAIIPHNWIINSLTYGADKAGFENQVLSDSHSVKDRFKLAVQ